jgi:surface antigen
MMTRDQFVGGCLTMGISMLVARNVSAKDPKPAPQSQPSGDPCAKYYGHGYCTDYIQQRVGRKPPGDAGTWPGNVALSQIHHGDVAIFSLPLAGHVAYVEEVARDKAGHVISVRVSEKNWGRVKADNESRQCVITENFNTVTSRTVPLNHIARVWRP